MSPYARGIIVLSFTLYRIALYRAVSEKNRKLNTRIKRQHFPMHFVFGLSGNRLTRGPGL